MGVSVLTGFSGAPFAKRHWQLSNQFNYFGHRVIACLEYLPVLGALVALIEKVVVAIFKTVPSTLQFVPIRRIDLVPVPTPPSREASVNTLEPIRNPALREDPANILVSVMNSAVNNVSDNALTTLYQEDTPQALQGIIDRQLSIVDQAYQKSKKLMKSSTSKRYSMCVSEAEEAIHKLEIIAKVLQEKNEPVNELQLKERKAILKTMYDDMPMGESIPLRLDLELLKSASIPPKEPTYTNELGTFYNPKVAYFDLTRWFAPYELEGRYLCPAADFKTHHVGTNIKLDRMVTCFELVKSSEQRKKERKVIKTTAVAKGQAEIQVVNIQNRNKQVGFFSIFKKEDIDYQTLQKNVLEKLQQALPDMLEIWNFESFEILPSEELYRSGCKREVAYASDRILFYHKRVRKSDRVEELSDDVKENDKVEDIKTGVIENP